MVYLKNGTVITNREGFFNKSDPDTKVDSASAEDLKGFLEELDGLLKKSIGKNVTGTICLGTLYINVEEIAAVHYKLDKEW